MPKVRVAIHGRDSTTEISQVLLSTIPLFTVQIINSVDMVTQKKVVEVVTVEAQLKFYSRLILFLAM